LTFFVSYDRQKASAWTTINCAVPNQFGKKSRGSFELPPQDFGDAVLVYCSGELATVGAVPFKV
jgi:hypothetical protein